ncbi:unnamed protein product [Rotaria sp. Silwood2]|nr:unnamed protein product [Rotaria sp. Silwood2]
MPYKSKRQSQSLNAVKGRWLNGFRLSSDDSSYSMESTDEDETAANFNLKDMIQISDIADLFEFCKKDCNIRYLSVLFYLTLRRFNISYEETHMFLKSVGGLTGEVAHKWANVFMNGNFDEFINDGRGGKQENCFYDVYPEIEVEGRAFAVIQCTQKAASFTAYDLAHFIDKRFYEINDINKSNSDLVRSVESCRLDLRNWGARFETNTNRPYFEGHDRQDVVTHRHGFIHHFLTNKDNYYSISPDEDPHFQVPKSFAKTILICKT